MRCSARRRQRDRTELCGGVFGLQRVEVEPTAQLPGGDEPLHPCPAEERRDLDVDVGRHLDAVEQLLGDAVALTHNQFVTKMPSPAERASEIPLHQDNGYGRLDPPHDVTVWVALTDTHIDNGCLLVAPGSHRDGLVQHRVAAHNRAFREAATTDVRPLELPAGHAVAFSGLLLHGSGDNRTERERVALFARYCRPDVVMVTDGERPVLDDPHSWMVRGDAPLSTWRSVNTKFNDDATT